jgi:hypothetical protein
MTFVPAAKTTASDIPESLQAALKDGLKQINFLQPKVGPAVKVTRSNARASGSPHKQYQCKPVRFDEVQHSITVEFQHGGNDTCYEYTIGHPSLVATYINLEKLKGFFADRTYDGKGRNGMKVPLACKVDAEADSVRPAEEAIIKEVPVEVKPMTGEITQTKLEPSNPQQQKDFMSALRKSIAAGGYQRGIFPLDCIPILLLELFGFEPSAKAVGAFIKHLADSELLKRLEAPIKGIRPISTTNTELLSGFGDVIPKLKALQLAAQAATEVHGRVQVAEATTKQLLADADEADRLVAQLTSELAAAKDDAAQKRAAATAASQETEKLRAAVSPEAVAAWEAVDPVLRDLIK